MIPTSAVHIEGGILSNDLLTRLRLLDPRLPGIAPMHYERAPGESIHEAIGRSWSRLTSVWRNFSRFLASAPEGQALTGDTRDRWLIPLFQELGFGKLERSETRVLDKSNFPISHRWQRLPIHLIGARLPLDRRTKGVAHAASASPHGLLQDFLNRSDESLWGVVTNGLSLRLLRDNAALTRQAFVEFDLEDIFSNELYAEFVLLWLLIHASRFSGSEPRSWIIEQWAKAAAESGARALERLRDGVEKALADLGSGFIAHPANAALIDRLRSGQLKPDDYKRQLLRIIYRLLFIFVAEERDLLLDPSAPREAADRYRQHYSTRLLRERAVLLAGTPHGDGWEHLKLLVRMLAAGETRLGLPALGSDLFEPGACPDLDLAQLANKYLYSALRHLCITRDGDVKRPTDFRSLGAEELGGIYESLLELNPTVNLSARSFALKAVSGNERKTTGSYYTPTELISCLLDSALDPVVDQALKQDPTGKAILNLKICDPACGSGHFLVAAAHRMAHRLAAARTGEPEPSPQESRHALREIIARCIYGVDVNPLAVELCQVSLWLEALEPGKPLSYLRHRIRCGDSLLGATPELIAAGIPDGAFDALTGDDKKIAAGRKKRNKSEREDLGARSASLFAQMATSTSSLEQALAVLGHGDDGTPEGIRRIEAADRLVRENQRLVAARWAADLWTASFFLAKRDETPAISTQMVRQVAEGSFDAITKETANLVRGIRDELRFFHWHIEFPDVFPPEGPAGFDVLLGNPPWERVKIQETEWFSQRRPDIAMAPTASSRKALIARLASEDPALQMAYRTALRSSEAESTFLRRSGRFPLTGRGDINSYAAFAELLYTITARNGSCGMIVPSGILTDDTTKLYFKELQGKQVLAQAIDFENNETLFPGVGHGRMRFCLLTIRKGDRTQAARFFFLARSVADLANEKRWCDLSDSDSELINPNSGTCPVLLSRTDAEITKRVYSEFPVLRRETPETSPWGVSLHRLFDMTTDSGLLRTSQQLIGTDWHREARNFKKGRDLMLPIVEGKMVTFYDHRAAHIRFNPQAPTRQQQPQDASDTEKQNPAFFPEPYLWAPECEARTRFERAVHRDWAIVFKRVTSATNWRTMVACVVPSDLAISYTLYLVAVSGAGESQQHSLLAILNSLAYDYFIRQKSMQPSLPIGPVLESVVPPPESFDVPASWTGKMPLRDWIAPKVAELTCVSNDLASFAKATIHMARTFQWVPERRDLLRAELDAMAFHHFKMARSEVEHVLSTFPKVQEYDLRKHGVYRTRDLTLRAYDEMAAAGARGIVYQGLRT